MDQNSEIQTEIKVSIERQKQIDDAQDRIIEAEKSFRRISEELSVFDRMAQGCFTGFDKQKTPVAQAQVVETKMDRNPAKKTPTHPVNSILPNTLMNFDAENPNTGNSLDVQWESLADEINNGSEDTRERVGTIIRSVRIRRDL